MKKVIALHIVIALILMVGSTFSNSAHCQSRQGRQGRMGQQGHHGPPPCPLVTALDTNNDNMISTSELQNASTVLLKLDKDGDGRLNEDEIRPDENEIKQGDSNEQRRGNHTPPPSPIFTSLDSNSDGTIDSDEIENATSALTALDSNSDGELTRDELRPQRGPKGQRGHRH